MSKYPTNEWCKENLEYKDGNLFWRATGKLASSRSAVPYLWHKDFGICMLGRVVWTLLKGNAPDGLEVWHEDGDFKNNRIENLFLLSKSDMAKRRKRKEKRFDTVRGVFQHSDKKHWVACVTKNKVRTYLGVFKDKADADAAILATR